MAKKRKSDNEIIDELVAAATPEETSVVDEIIAAPVIVVEEPKATPAPKVEKRVETLTPGEYYQGKKIQKYIARLGKQWVVVLEGKRVKINKDEIVKVK